MFNKKPVVLAISRCVSFIAIGACAVSINAQNNIINVNSGTLPEGSVFVSKFGNDVNDGDKNRPFLTIHSPQRQP